MSHLQFFIVAMTILIIVIISGVLQWLFERKSKPDFIRRLQEDALRAQMTEGIALGYAIMHRQVLLGDQDGDLISVLHTTYNLPYPNGRYLIKGETPEIIAADIDLGEAGL